MRFWVNICVILGLASSSCAFGICGGLSQPTAVSRWSPKPKVALQDIRQIYRDYSAFDNLAQPTTPELDLYAKQVRTSTIEQKKEVFNFLYDLVADIDMQEVHYRGDEAEMADVMFAFDLATMTQTNSSMMKGQARNFLIDNGPIDVQAFAVRYLASIDGDSPLNRSAIKEALDANNGSLRRRMKWHRIARISRWAERSLE